MAVAGNPNSTSQPVRYYRHSGSIPFVGAVLGILAGLIVAVVGAVAYGYADLWIPIINANILLPLAFGAALGFVPAVVMRSGKVRNTLFTVVITMIITAIGYYACWTTWICAAWDRFADEKRDFGMVELAGNPNAVLELGKMLNKTGTWSIGHSVSSSSGNASVSGIPLTIVWIGEAAMIFTTAFVVSRKTAAEHPFCDDCNNWASKTSILGHFTPADPNLISARMLAGDFSIFKTIPRVTGDQPHVWLLEHNGCESCGQFNTVRVVDRMTTQNKKGNVQNKRKYVVHRLVLGQQQMDSLRSAIAPPTAPVVNVGQVDEEDVSDEPEETDET